MKFYWNRDKQKYFCSEHAEERSVAAEDRSLTGLECGRPGCKRVLTDIQPVGLFRQGRRVLCGEHVDRQNPNSLIDSHSQWQYDVACEHPTCNRDWRNQGGRPSSEYVRALRDDPTRYRPALDVGHGGM